MKTTIEWLDEAKKIKGLSDYALAPLLGLSRAQISRYRTGVDYLSESSAVKLAALIGVDPLQVLASAAAERSKSDEVRAVWMKYAEALATFTGAMVLGTVLSAPVEARAAGQEGAANATSSVYYVNRRRKRTIEAEALPSSKTGLFHPGFFSSQQVPHLTP